MEQAGRVSRRLLSVVCLLLVSSSGAASGQPITLVKDLRTEPNPLWVQPSAMVAAGSSVYFVSTGVETGPELWVSDGTPGGSRLVKDIRPGKEGPNLQQLTNVSGTLFFQADDGTNGAELWKSDGTEAGTVMVKDISPGPDGSGPWSLAAMGGVVYFSASDGGPSGQELWRSDGTASGTFRVKDVYPGTGSSNPSNIVAVGGVLYFGAIDANGQELWKSDGTEAGTVFVKDICGGACGSNPGSFVGAGGVVYFTANDGVGGQELWKTDGTPGGTALVKDVRAGSGGSSPQSLTNVGGTLFFSADDGVSGREPWKSDGTDVGTLLVRDVCVGACGSAPSGLTAMGDLFFSANDGVHGREYWRSDGTLAGTALLKDICPGNIEQFVTPPAVLAGKLYFQANDCVDGAELWSTDGTEGGTQLVMNLCVGCSGNPAPIVAAGSVIFFGANDGAHGPQLWKSDGTGGGTVRLTDATVPSSFPGSLTDLAGTLVFAAYDPLNTWRTLWRSDGSAAGTTQLAAGRLFNPGGLVAHGGKVFLSGDSGGGNYELWSTDGTEDGTALVTEICPGGCSANPSFLTSTGGLLFFVANDGTNGNELWASDGTETGTRPVKDVWPGAGSSSIQNVARVGSRVFFAASDGTNGRELWVSDGTLDGTRMVKDLWPGSPSSNPRYLTDVNGTLFFTASDGTRERLFRSDGTAAGTTALGNVFAYESVDLNGVLVFMGSWGNSELWRSDGTTGGTALLRDINPGGSSTPTHLTVAGPWVYFRATDGSSGVELWRSDGTTAGTHRVRDVNPGAGSSLPRDLTPVGSGLYFVANDGVHGEELWKTDGTEAGTFLVQDLFPGAAHSGISQILPTPSRLYLSGDDGTTGLELRALGAADLAVSVTASDPAPLQGSTLRWTVTVSNGGPSAATGVTLLDTLPAGVSFVSSSPAAPACTLASGTLTCVLGTIAAGADAVVTIDATVDAGVTGALANGARAAAFEPDPNGANDAATVTVTVPGPQPATNLQATATSASSIALAWASSPSPHTDVRIDRSTDGSAWAEAGSVAAGVTAFTDAPLSAGTLFHYRVVVRQAGVGESVPSNVAAARTFPASAAKVCATRLGEPHRWSRYPSVAWNGERWGAVVQTRAPEREFDEVRFQLLDGPSGLPVGSPVNVSDDDMPSSYPTIRWNGSRFAVVWSTGMRGPAGESVSYPTMALLDAAGNKVGGNLALFDNDGPAVYLNTSYETAVAWTGSEWGVVVPVSDGAQAQLDLYLVRVSPEGERIGAPVRLTDTPEDEWEISLAWNGTTYGVSWMRQGGVPSVYFQTVQADGTLAGSPTLVLANPDGVGTTSTVWDGTGWAVAFVEAGAGPDYPSWIDLARLDAAGALLGSPVRVSPDFDPGFPPEDQVPTYDEMPVLFAKPGGAGYVVFTSSGLTTGSLPYEIGRYETDAGGSRVGARTIVSNDDDRHSAYARAAFDGSRYLVVYNDGSPGTQEIARVIAGASGPPLAGPALVSSGGSPGNSWAPVTGGPPLALAVGDGFAVVWGELAADLSNLLGVRVFDGAGNVAASQRPISTRACRGRPAGVGVGDTFALAWKDGSNNVVFQRYDATGTPLFGEVVLATAQGGRPAVAAAYSGESYGLAWNQGTSLVFQRVASDGALVGPRTTVALGTSPANVPMQVAWTGAGWAVVYVLGTDLQYVLLDRSGAVSVPPVAVTASTSAKNVVSVAWSGTKLGVAWTDNPGVPPFQDILFTVLGLDGVPEFAPVDVASSDFNEGNPSLYWDADRFRLVHTFGQTTVLREVAILPNGALAGEKLLANRGGTNSVAFNGVTAGIAWQQLIEDFFETTACTDDATPPACPAPTASLNGRTVTVSWPAVADAESGVYRYYVYRDGSTLAELLPSTTSVRDGAFTAGSTHVYEVRAYNGAWLESMACTAVSPTADLSVSKDDGAANEVPGTPVNWTITVTNGGPSTVSSVMLADPVPPAVTGAAFTPAAGGYDAGTGLWSGLALGPGQSATMTLAATIGPAARGTLSNTATVAVTPGVVDPNGANDAATDSDALVPSADLSVTLSDAPDPVPQLATLTYVIGVSNAGPSTATGVVLTLALPAGVAFEAAAPGAAACAHSSGTVTCSLGMLAPGANVPVTVTARPTAGTVGVVTANASVAAAEADPAGGNDAASAQTTVVGPAPARDLQVTTRTATSVGLKWVDPQGGETGFRIERSTDGSAWSQVTIVAGDATSYTNTGRSPATLYYYRVTARKDDGSESAPSNVAATTTLATAAAKVCATRMGPYVANANGPSVAGSGAGWAAAWTERRDGLQEEVTFQLLEPDAGTPLGSPTRVSSTGAPSIARTLRWNGSRYGLLWSEHLKEPDGSGVTEFRFTSFDAAGNRTQGDVPAFRLENRQFHVLNGAEIPLVWNGEGWGVFLAEEAAPPSDVRYYRLAEDGSLVGAPVDVAATGEWELAASAAWNGSEYGVVWVTQGTTAGPYRVLFRRVARDGTLLGSPALLWESTTASTVSFVSYYTSILWNGSGWVTAFTDVGTDESGQPEAVWLRKVSAAGAPDGAAVRLSHDFDPSVPPEEQAPVFDELPVLFAKPGGGYVVFTSSWLNSTGMLEVCRYEADASLARTGSRTQLSADGNGATALASSGPARAASGASRFLLAFNESRPNDPEIAGILVDAAGAILSGPTDLTSGHASGSSQNPIALPLGSGFGALYTYVDPATATTKLAGAFWDGSGAPTAARVPLSARTTRGTPGAVALGETFALAWKDGSNNVVFGRFDATGAPLGSETVLATGAGGRPNLGLAFSGEDYGVAYWAGQNLWFQRVTPAGVPAGPRVTVATSMSGGTPSPQVQWVGSGWAIVWQQAGDLYYSLLDAAGGVAVAPIPVTFTPQAEGPWKLLWTGSHLGLAWHEYQLPDPPGGKVFFTVLSLQGIKAFDPVTLGASDYDDTYPSVYWDVDRFRVVMVPGSPNVLREVAILPDGTVQPGERTYFNRGGTSGVAWNGATLGITWKQLGFTYFETTACLADTTPPPCPGANAVFDGSGTTVSWTPVEDADSGIWSYGVYRDGRMVAEEPATATSWADTAPEPGVNHAYEVRALNAAMKESTACTAVVPSADLSVTMVDAPDPAPAGGTLTYTLTVRNAGPSAAAGVSLTDTLPAGVTFVSSSPAAPGCTHAAGTVSCNLGTLASDASTVVTIVVALSSSGSISNAASVAAQQPDPAMGNNSASATTTVTPTCHALVTAVIPSGMGSVSVGTPENCPGGYLTGTPVALTANPPTGRPFASWFGTGGTFESATENPTTFTVSGEAVATAIFGPWLAPIDLPIVVGATNTFAGAGFTQGTVIKLFVSTASGPLDTNTSGWTPTSWTPDSLTWDVPPGIPLGQGFATLLVVNTDQTYIASNVEDQLLYGDETDGLPTILTINGAGIRASDPSIPGAHVETVLGAGSTVTIAGTGFNSPLVNLFTASGNIGPLTPLTGGTATEFRVVIPESAPAGPGTFQVVNAGAGWKLSNAVDTVLRARITVASIEVAGATVTVTGDGFCPLTVINLFNAQGGGVVNLGGLAGATPLVPLTYVDPQHFVFAIPAGAQAGRAYVQALNPPYTPFTSSGTDPGGAFVIP